MAIVDIGIVIGIEAEEIVIGMEKLVMLFHSVVIVVVCYSVTFILQYQPDDDPIQLIISIPFLTVTIR